LVPSETLAVQPTVYYNLFETVVWLGSHFGTGATTEDALVPLIWANFHSRAVTTVDGAPMHYYGTQNYEHTWQRSVSDLIAHKNSECGGWAELFHFVLKAQGLGVPDAPVDRRVNMVEIVVQPAAGPAGLPLRMAIKNWTFNAAGTDSPYAGFDYKLDRDATDDNGLPGQNNLNPYSRFKNHQVVVYNNQIYDPSYGEKFSGADWNATQLAWENASIAGIYILHPDPGGPNSGYMRRKDQTKLETQFSNKGF